MLGPAHLLAALVERLPSLVQLLNIAADDQGGGDRADSTLSAIEGRRRHVADSADARLIDAVIPVHRCPSQPAWA
jgi:hypothetical protein